MQNGPNLRSVPCQRQASLPGRRIPPHRTPQNRARQAFRERRYRGCIPLQCPGPTDPRTQAHLSVLILWHVFGTVECSELI